MAEIRAVIYLESNKFSFYIPGLEHPLNLAFPTAAAAFMEVLNKELIYNQIQTFVVSNKLTPCICTIILGNDVTFQKVIRQTQQTQKAEMIQEFINNVPFDNVAQISYDSAETTYIFGTNEELFTTVRRGFEKLGYGIDAVIPVAMIANANISPGTQLTAQTASFLLENSESVKQYNFINVRQEIALRAAKKSKTPTAKKDRKNEKILGGVFASLLVVLLVVFLSTQNSVTPPSPQAAAPIVPQVQTAPPTTTQPNSQSPRTDGKDAVTIKIVSTSEGTNKAGKIKTALAQAGFTTIESESTASAISSVSFSDTISEINKNEFLTILRPIMPDYTVLSHVGLPTHIILSISQ